MPLWFVIAAMAIVLALQTVSVYMGYFPKRVLIPTLLLGGLLILAAYYHSWWIVMCAFFLWLYKYMQNEFDGLKERLTRIEAKMDAISSSTEPEQP
ncbi:MAG: hypothetical protein LAP86_25060 [Acidobacteriia bacterium]|nr:hypothetical protein [Terriglobia bacterium]